MKALDRIPAEPRLDWPRYWKILKKLEPDARSAQDAYSDRVLALLEGRRWLDAGCGRTSFAAWRTDLRNACAHGTILTGCDLDLTALRDRSDRDTACARLETLPFRDCQFELVTANMVFEHLEQPTASVRELARVTARSGRIVIHTVNARHYLALFAHVTPHRFHQWIVKCVEGRASQDVYPTRYRANTERVLRELFELAGCRLVAGGVQDNIPLHLPHPRLLRFGIWLGVLERRLARLPGLRSWLCPNLLMEFERL